MPIPISLFTRLASFPDRDKTRAAIAVRHDLPAALRQAWINESPTYLDCEQAMREFNALYAADVAKTDARLVAYGLPSTSDKFENFEQIGRHIGFREMKDAPSDELRPRVDKWARRRRERGGKRVLPDLPDGVEGVVAAIVEFWILKRDTQRVIGRDELASVAGELWCKAMAKLHRYDPDKGSVQTFIDTVVERDVKTVVRASRRRHRRERRELDAAHDAAVARTLAAGADVVGSIAHAEFVAETLESMSAEDAAICRVVTSSKTMAEAARELDMPASTLKSRLQRIGDRHFSSLES